MFSKTISDWDFCLGITTLRNKHLLANVTLIIRDVTRSCGARSDVSHEIRLVSRERNDILSKYFTLFTLELHNESSWMTTIPLSIKTVSHRECQWSVRSMFYSCPCWWIRGSAITLPMWMLSFTDMFLKSHCSSSTDTRDVKRLKTFKSAFMLLLIQKEQHKQSFQPHIIISVTDI